MCHLKSSYIPPRVYVITLWGTLRSLWGSFIGCKVLQRFKVLLSTFHCSCDCLESEDNGETGVAFPGVSSCSKHMFFCS